MAFFVKQVLIHCYLFLLSMTEILILFCLSGVNADFTEEVKFNDTLSSADLEDNDKTVIDIIKRIEELQSHVGKLKTRIDNVVRENPERFCSVTQLGMIGPSDGLNHLGHNGGSLVGNDNTFPVRCVRASSQYKSELNTEDLFLTQNTLPTLAMETPFIETSNMPHLEFLQENVSFVSYPNVISTCMLFMFSTLLALICGCAGIGYWLLLWQASFSMLTPGCWFCLVSVTGQKLFTRIEMPLNFYNSLYLAPISCYAVHTKKLRCAYFYLFLENVRGT